MVAESLGSTRKSDLPPWLWVGLPLASVALRVLTPLLGEARWQRLMTEETGLIEILTVIYLLPTVVLGVVLWRRRKALPRGVGSVMLLAALAALYFAGEECSWGQTYLKFATPESLRRINDQGEFNIHNIELEEYGFWVDILDDLANNVPRALMSGFTLVGGIILPLACHRRLNRSDAPRRWWYWLIPNYRMIPIAVIALSLRAPDRIATVFLGGEPARDSYVSMALYRASGEFKEYCFAIIMLFYLLSVYLRCPRRGGTGDGAPVG